MATGALNFGMVLSVIDKATAPLRGVVAGIQALNERVEKAGKVSKAWKDARENVVDFTERSKAALASLIQPAREVQDALTRVAVEAGPKLNEVAGDLDRLKASSLAWQKAHLGSATTFISTSAIMLRATTSQTDALKATQVAMQVATATGKPASAMAETLTILYGQMSDKTKDAGDEFRRFGDIVTKASQTFNGFEAEKLADPLKDALPAAKAAGVSVEQTVAIMGTLNAAGIKGGESGAAFAAALEKMQDGAKALGVDLKKTSTGGLDMVDTLAEIEKKFGPINKMTPQVAAKLQAAFGPAGFKLLSATIGQTDQLNRNLAELTNSANAAANAASKIEGSDTAQLQIVEQNIDALKVEIATGLLPAVKEIVPHVKTAVTAIGGFVKEHPGLVAFVGTVVSLAIGIGTVLGPLLSLGGALAAVSSFLGITSAATAFAATVTQVGLIPALIGAASSAWAFAAAMMANPITWIVLAIIALAAVLYIYWEPISQFFVDLWDEVKVGFESAWNVILALWASIKSTVSAVYGAVVGVWDRIVKYFQGAIADIKATFRVSFVGGLTKIFTYFSPVALFARAWSVVVPWILGLWSRALAATWSGLKWLGAAITRGAVAAWEAIPRAFSALGDFLASVWAWIKEGFADGILNGLARLFLAINPVSWIVAGWNALVEWLFGLSLLDAAMHIVDTIVDGLTSAGGAVLDFFRGLWSSVWDFFGPGIENDLNTVSGFFGSAWDSIEDIVVVGVAAVMGVLAFLNPLTAISAAWSLVMPYLGSVWDGIKSLLSRGVAAALSVLALLNPITPLAALWNALPGYIDSIWTTLKGLVDQGVSALMAALAALNPLAPIMQAWEAVTQWFASFSLAEAGQNIVNTIVEGMKSAANAPVEAMKGIVQDVRNLLPFSPAKEGPLADLDKVKMVETVAESVKPAPLVNAMTDVADKTMTALQKTAPTDPIVAPPVVPSVPIVAPITMPTLAEPPTPAMRTALSPASSSSAGSSSSSAPVSMQVSITIQGADTKTPLDSFKEWLQDPENARQVYVAVQRVAGNEQRKELA